MVDSAVGVSMCVLTDVCRCPNCNCSVSVCVFVCPVCEHVCVLTQYEAHEGVVAEQQHVAQERAEGDLHAPLLQLLEAKLLHSTKRE